ncbi:hypothetical protein GQ53DRAFT_748164 [Thozetella sp. PMI_491]|nr:hypothetical protein GQ53DRAFT_748164 [Thozetella sp. PMI_491]
MAGITEAKVCDACAKAKRRCGRDLPSCKRCMDKGIDCVYPPPKQGHFILLDQALSTQEDVPMVFEQHNGQPSNLDLLLRDATGVPLELDFASHGTSTPVWFLQPDTWKINHQPAIEASRFSTVTLSCHIARLQKWLEEWVKSGRNQFIHHQLYHARFPSCVQIAYATLSGYINRTEENKHMILRVVEDQARQLLMQKGIHPGSSESPQSAVGSEFVDSLEQLAQVHALLVYQTIGLLDGDIRSRHQAEARIAALDRLAMQMLENSSRDLGRMAAAIDPLDLEEAGKNSLLGPHGPMDMMWHTWILAESIRRTWLVATGFQAIYLTLQEGWHPCPGSVMFTSRQGVWDAQTAFEWGSFCSEVDIGFVQRYACEKFFTDSRPVDIDEFTKMIVETTFGAERLQRWQ